MKSLYIHIPFCISKCAYCDFFSKPFSFVRDDYVSALCMELKYRLQHTDSLETVYIGGGTPSLLSKEQLIKITKEIPVSLLKEFTVEVNPDDVTIELLETFQAVGVTRISCGIQSFNDKVLSFCNRRAKRNQVLEAINLFAENWKGRLSLDLISGLPYETESSFLEGLELVCNSTADHISLYSLTIEEETPLGKAIEEGSVEYDFDAADTMWLKGRNFLENHGFSQYEVSNFCKDGKVSLHNMTYWSYDSYIGAGSGGTGTMYKSDGSSFRYTNSSNLEGYISFWTHLTNIGNLEKINEKDIPQETEEVSAETGRFEFFMMGLRTISGVSKNRYEKLFHEGFPCKIAALFEKWQKENIAEITCIDGDVFYSLGKKGILFLNRFLQEMDL